MKEAEKSRKELEEAGKKIQIISPRTRQNKYFSEQSGKGMMKKKPNPTR